MNKQKLQGIADGYFKYLMDNFQQASKLPWVKIKIDELYPEGSGKYELVVELGAGWFNTPWKNSLLDFLNSLNKRVETKYPFIIRTTICGYSSRNYITAGPGLIDMKKMEQQMSFEEVDH